MGWDYMSDIRSREDMIWYVTRPRTEAGGNTSVRLYNHFWEKGPVSHLWTVTHDSTLASTGDERSQMYITLFLIEKDDRGPGYGYKAIDESAVPYYFTCPTGFFDEALAFQRPNWRAAVRLYDALRSGDTPWGDTDATNHAIAFLKECQGDNAKQKPRRPTDPHTFI